MEEDDDDLVPSGCLVGLVGRAAPSAGVDWSPLRATSFSVRAKTETVFKQMDVVVEAVDIQGGVMGQVDVGPQDTVSGHAAVGPVDGVRVEGRWWRLSMTPLSDSSLSSGH